MTPSPSAVRDFVVATCGPELVAAGHDPANLPDDFDLLLSGVIDSFGVLELIVEVNEHFGLDIDFEELDPEGLTLVGPFSRYVAAAAAAAVA